uniref:Envelope fusion protein n=1 Tax=Sipha flava TaxID=143950 RepID=A0A2S2Q120_9HEMI
MAISKTHGYYLTLSSHQIAKCRELATGTLCPETQPLRLGTTEVPCETELFIKPTSMPATCSTRYLDITRSVYHKLKYHNTWIFIIKSMDNLAISCEDRDQTINTQLTGIGAITLAETCRAYTPQMVLTPNRHLNSFNYVDFIPETELVTNLTIPNFTKKQLKKVITHIKPIIKLNDMGDYSKSLSELDLMIAEETNRNKLENKSDLHTYLFIIIVVIAITYVGVKIIKKQKNKRTLHILKCSIMVPRNSPNVEMINI